MFFNRKLASSSKQMGFTLAEVTLALAIFASGLILVFAMLPQSLNNLRNASSLSMKQRIAQNLIGEIMLSDWDTIHDFSTDNNRRFFNSQGVPSEDFDGNTVFTARVLVIPRDVNLDQNRSLELVAIPEGALHNLADDDGNISNSTNQHARRVVVEVTDIARDNFDFENPDTARTILRVGTVLANFNEVNTDP